MYDLANIFFNAAYARCITGVLYIVRHMLFNFPCNSIVNCFSSLLQNFAVELLFDDIHEVKLDKIRSEVVRAGGANYGVGR